MTNNFTIGERIRANANLEDKRYDGLFGIITNVMGNEVCVSFEWPQRVVRRNKLIEAFPQLKGKTETDYPFCLEDVMLPFDGVNSLQTVTVEATAFLNAITKASKALAKSSVPTLENVRILFDGKSCIITGSNLEHWLEMEIPASGGTLEIVPRDTNMLIKACKHFKEDIVFAGYPHDDTFALTSGSKSATQTCYPDEAYPETPALEETVSYKVNAKTLFDRIGKISYATSKSDNRPVYRSICFADNRVAACDGYRLAVNQNASLAVEDKFLLLLQSLKLLDTFGNDEIQMDVSAKHVRFSGPMQDVQLCIRKVEGEFPNLERIIPKDSDIKEVYGVKVSEYIDELKYLKDMMAKGKKEYVKFDSGKLSILTERGEFSAKVTLDGDADIVYGFNGDYVIDALNHLKESKNIEIKVTGKSSAFILTGNGADLALVLPVRMNEDVRQKAA